MDVETRRAQLTTLIELFRNAATESEEATLQADFHATAAEFEAALECEVLTLPNVY